VDLTYTILASGDDCEINNRDMLRCVVVSRP